MGPTDRATYKTRSRLWEGVNMGLCVHTSVTRDRRVHVVAHRETSCNPLDAPPISRVRRGHVRAVSESFSRA